MADSPGRCQNAAMARPEEHELVLGRIAAELSEIAPVDFGTMFRRPGLRFNGKIIAFLGHDGRLVVKLPRNRGLELIDAGQAEVLTMGKRTMREWFAIPSSSDSQSTHDNWLGLARQALEFVRVIEATR